MKWLHSYYSFHLIDEAFLSIMKPTSSSSAGPRTLEIKLNVLDALCSGDDVVLMKLSNVPHSIPPPLDLFLHLLVIMRHPDALRYLGVSTPSDET